MTIPDPTQIGCGGWVPPTTIAKDQAPSPSAAAAGSLATIKAVIKQMVDRGELEEVEQGRYRPTAKFPKAVEDEINRLLDLREENS